MKRNSIVLLLFVCCITVLAGCQSSKAASDDEYVDTSTDLSAAPVNAYGTTAAFGTVEKIADTSSSIVVDWYSEPPADVSGYSADEDNDVVYKVTELTDGYDKGEMLELTLNVRYHSNSPSPTPCVIFVPGGGFMAANPSRSRLTEQKYLAMQGFAVVGITYRVVGQGLFSDGIADMNDAIRYVKANADKYNIDPERIALLGNSAGGYMVAMTAASEGVEDFIGDNNLEYSTAVQAVIDQYGITDMASIGIDYSEEVQAVHHSALSSESQYVNGVFSGIGITADPESAARADVLTYIDGNEPPFLLMHGSADGLVSPSQTLILHEALLEAGESSVRYSLTGSGHGQNGFDSEVSLRMIADFLWEIFSE